MRERYATAIISSPSDKRASIADYEEWSGLYITERKGCVHDCHIEEVTGNYSCIKLQEDNE